MTIKSRAAGQVRATLAWEPLTSLLVPQRYRRSDLRRAEGGDVAGHERDGSQDQQVAQRYAYSAFRCGS
jgi:hypothetical protein